MKIVTHTLKKNHNVSDESDSKRFIRYAWFFLFLLLGIYVFFISLSYIAIGFISIEDEKQWIGSEPSGIWYEAQPLPDNLVKRYETVPYEISIIDMESENAFASLGGYIYVTQDLLDSIEYYESLDFIIGHEIGHIEHRDVLKSIVSDAPLSLFVSFFGGEYGSTLFTGILSNNYSKIQETMADRYGLDFVQTINNHVGCASLFFENKNTLTDNALELFSTHPMTELRIQRIESYIEEQWYSEEECTPFNL